MPKNRIARLLAAAIIVGAIVLVSHGLSFAVVGVQPECIEIVVDTDAATNGAYSVVNDGEETVRVLVQPEAWPKPALKDGLMPVDKWLSVSPVEFNLAPKESKPVHFTINAPAGHPAELSAMVFFATDAPEGGMKVVTRNGVSLYAAFADMMRPECSLTGITAYKFEQKTDSGTIDRGIVFTLNIENKGNVHLRPAGSVLVKCADGLEHTLNIERGFPTYPAQKGSYEVLLEKKDVVPGKCEVVVTLDYGRLFGMDKKIVEKKTFTVGEDGTVS
jgi:hypothetical protein